MKNHISINWNRGWIGLFFLASMMFLRCTSQNPTNDGGKQEKFDNDANALKAKNDSSTKALQAMEMDGILQRLTSDAKQLREPFNSPAYRELVKNRKDKGSELLAAIQRRQGGTYLDLLALRKIAPNSYMSLDTGMRARILLDALSNSNSYNLWGLPHLYWEEAAKAIVELGLVVKPGLKAMLDDKSPAPVYGSEEHTEYLAYRYRRGDYALALLMAIRGESAQNLPKSPEERDKLIDAEKIL